MRTDGGPRQLLGSATRPVLELKGFKRLMVAPGETRPVVFELAAADLAFLRGDMTWGTEPGQFQVFVGLNRSDLKSASFTLEAGMQVAQRR